MHINEKLQKIIGSFLAPAVSTFIEVASNERNLSRKLIMHNRKIKIAKVNKLFYSELNIKIKCI